MARVVDVEVPARHEVVAPTPAGPATWVWMGAHGGAGVTTLAGALGGLADVNPFGGEPMPVVVVARTHRAGLEAAQGCSTEFDVDDVNGDLILLGLVLVADAPGRLPPALQDLAHVVAGGYPRCWTVRWSTELRFGAYRPDHLPRRVRRLGEELQMLSQQETERKRMQWASPE